MAAIIITEVLITLKFDWHTFTKPLPDHVTFGWSIGLAVLAIWTIWHFYLQRLLRHTEVQSLATDTAAADSSAASMTDNTGRVRHRKARTAETD